MTWGLGEDSKLVVVKMCGKGPEAKQLGNPWIMCVLWLAFKYNVQLCGHDCHKIGGSEWQLNNPTLRFVYFCKDEVLLLRAN